MTSLHIKKYQTNQTVRAIEVTPTTLAGCIEFITGNPALSSHCRVEHERFDEYRDNVSKNGVFEYTSVTGQKIVANLGDYIVDVGAVRFMVVKPDVFKAEYTLVEEPEEDSVPFMALVEQTDVSTHAAMMQLRDELLAWDPKALGRKTSEVSLTRLMFLSKNSPHEMWNLHPLPDLSQVVNGICIVECDVEETSDVRVYLGALIKCVARNLRNKSSKPLVTGIVFVTRCNLIDNDLQFDFIYSNNKLIKSRHPLSAKKAEYCPPSLRKAILNRNKKL